MASVSRPKIYFFSLGSDLPLRNRQKLKKFIFSIFKKEGRKLGSLNYIFCSDKFLIKMNRQYLKHDFYTDIITFDLSSSNNEINGEIYISPGRIRENSKKNNTALIHEIHRVIIHGALHLCGYKDGKKNEKMLMRAKEDNYLFAYFR